MLFKDINTLTLDRSFCHQFFYLVVRCINPI